MIKKNTEITVSKLQKKYNPMLEKAKSIIIDNPKAMEISSEYLSIFNIAKDKATAQMETVTLPAKESIKAAEAIWKPFINAAKEAIQNIRDRQSQYQTEKKRIADEEKARIAARVGEGKGHLKVETAVNKIDQIETPEEEITTESGSVKFRTDKKFEILDIRAVPHDYLIVNEPMVRKAMLAGVPVPGIKYFEMQTPINRRG